MNSFIIPKASLENPGLISLDTQYIQGQKIFHITPDSKKPKDASKIKPAILILTGNLDTPDRLFTASNVDRGVFIIKETEDSGMDIVSLKAKGPSKFNNGIIIDKYYRTESGSMVKKYSEETLYGHITVRDNNCPPPLSSNHNTYCGIYSEGEDKLRKSQFLILSSMQGDFPYTNFTTTSNIGKRISCYGAWIKDNQPNRKTYFFTAMAGTDGQGSPGANVFSIFSETVNESGLSRALKSSSGGDKQIAAASMYLSGFLYGGWYSRSNKKETDYGEDMHFKNAGIHWITSEIPGLALNRISDGNIAVFSNTFPGSTEKRAGVLDATEKYGLRLANLISIKSGDISKSPNRLNPAYTNDENVSKNLITDIWNTIEGIKTYLCAKNGNDHNNFSNRTLNFYPSEVKEKYKQGIVTIEKSDGTIEDTGISYPEFVPVLWEAVNDLNKRLKKLESKG